MPVAAAGGGAPGTIAAWRSTPNNPSNNPATKAAFEAQKKAEVKAQAEQDQKTCDSLNYRDDQFDLSDAALAIAIAMLAVAALTQIWWMYWLSWVPIGFGVAMGLSGLLGWALHPDALTRLLS